MCIPMIEEWDEYIECGSSNRIRQSVRSVNGVWEQLNFSYVREKFCLDDSHC